MKANCARKKYKGNYRLQEKENDKKAMVWIRPGKIGYNFLKSDAE